MKHTAPPTPGPFALTFLLVGFLLLGWFGLSRLAGWA